MSTRAMSAESSFANARRSRKGPELKRFPFLKLVRKFRSGRLVRVQADVASLDELRERLGTKYVVEAPRRMQPFEGRTAKRFS